MRSDGNHGRTNRPSCNADRPKIHLLHRLRRNYYTPRQWVMTCLSSNMRTPFSRFDNRKSRQSFHSLSISWVIECKLKTSGNDFMVGRESLYDRTLVDAYVDRQYRLWTKKASWRQYRYAWRPYHVQVSGFMNHLSITFKLSTTGQRLVQGHDGQC